MYEKQRLAEIELEKIRFKAQLRQFALDVVRQNSGGVLSTEGMIADAKLVVEFLES